MQLLSPSNYVQVVSRRAQATMDKLPVVCWSPKCSTAVAGLMLHLAKRGSSGAVQRIFEGLQPAWSDPLQLLMLLAALDREATVLLAAHVLLPSCLELLRFVKAYSQHLSQKQHPLDQDRAALDLLDAVVREFTAAVSSYDCHVAAVKRLADSGITTTPQAPPSKVTVPHKTSAQAGERAVCSRVGLSCSPQHGSQHAAEPRLHTSEGVLQPG
jgi:hypothetical protein